MIRWQGLLSLKGYHKTRNDSSLNWVDVATLYLGAGVRGRGRGMGRGMVTQSMSYSAKKGLCR